MRIILRITPFYKDFFFNGNMKFHAFGYKLVGAEGAFPGVMI